MVIKKVPAAGVDVPVTVFVHGQCTHAQEGNVDIESPHAQNRRQLRGNERYEAATFLDSTRISATEMHYRSLSQMSQVECRSGNTTPCQTPTVLRQALYEKRQNDNLDRNVIVELDIQRESFVSSLPSRHVPGYIQTIGLHPFHVSFYTEGQINIYIAACKEGGCTIHFDATGSVIQKIPGQNKVFYYCLLLGESSITVLDFLTSSHTAAAIETNINIFQSLVRKCNNGKLVTPSVVTDFSYALMYATLRAFNNETFIDYLHFCFKVLRKKAKKKNKKSMAKLYW